MRCKEQELCMIGDKDDTPLVEFVRHTTLARGVCLDIHVLANFVRLQEGGQFNRAMFYYPPPSASTR